MVIYSPGGDPCIAPPPGAARRRWHTEAALTRGLHFDREHRMSRRALLGGGAALVAAAVAGLAETAAQPASTNHPPLAGRPLDGGGPQLAAPPDTAAGLSPPEMTTTTMVSPIPGVPIRPVALRSRPVFRLHDYWPAAPANAVALT